MGEQTNTIAIMAAIIYAIRTNQQSYQPTQARYDGAAKEARTLYGTVTGASGDVQVERA